MKITTFDLHHASEALELVLDFNAPADRILSGYFRQESKLGARNRAFVADSVYGVIRNLRLLRHLLGDTAPARLLILGHLVRFEGFSVRDIEPNLRGSEESRLSEMKAQRLADLPLAVRQSMPDWIMEAFDPTLADEALLGALNRPAPLDLRVNPLKVSRDVALKQLHDSGLPAEPTPYSPYGIRLLDKPAINRHPLFLDGSLEVQDEASQLVCLLVEPRRREMVFDFCAGAGGKTLLMGGIMAGQGRVYAADVAEKRLRNLSPRLKRSGLQNVQTMLLQHERDSRLKRLAGKFDRVLVDAPCSGLGTLRRNPDLKWRQQPQDLLDLSALQARILDQAASLVKPGGRLVYATCSLLPAENDAIIAEFLEHHPEYHQLDASDILARHKINVDSGQALRLRPDVHQTDGFFAAALEKH